jgi:hypothetical protein
VFAGAERIVGVSAALIIADAGCAIFGRASASYTAPLAIDSMHVRQEDFCLPYLLDPTAIASL